MLSAKAIEDLHPKLVSELVKPNFAWHTVLIDLIGPLPKSNHQHLYIIVAIDHLTKWVESRSVSNLGAITVAVFIIETIIHKHGCPQFILTDNATNFTSFVLPRLNKLMTIRGVLSTPYHPESNGMVEQVNSTFERILRKITTKHPSKWATFFSSAVLPII